MYALKGHCWDNFLTPNKGWSRGVKTWYGNLGVQDAGGVKDSSRSSQTPSDAKGSSQGRGHLFTDG
eukprot:12916494-Prorocentrum_lima.AAC.1